LKGTMFSVWEVAQKKRSKKKESKMGKASSKYDDEGREKIECLICGKYYHRLDVHLPSKHDLKVAEYRSKYPGAETISEHAKARASQGQGGKAKTAAAPMPVTQAETAEETRIEIEGEYRIGVAVLKKRDGLTELDEAYVPVHDENYIFGEVEMENWEDVAVGIEDGEPVYIGGPTGCGKTMGVMEMAAVLNQPVRRIQLNRDFKVGEFVGRGTLITDDEGNTVTGWKDGVLTEAMRNGWWLLLDEIDQAHPDVLMKLQAVLEGSPLVLTENFGEVVRPHDSFRVIATANTFGRGDEAGLYVGAKVMNEATMDRFGVVIKAEYPKAETEVEIIHTRTGLGKREAGMMVKVAHKVRESLEKEECGCTFSTRRLVAWAHKTMRYSGDARRASKTAILNKMEMEDARFVNHLIQRYFGGEV
jgi:cobaltochelatase CobS